MNGTQFRNTKLTHDGSINKGNSFFGGFDKKNKKTKKESNQVTDRQAWKKSLMDF